MRRKRFERDVADAEDAASDVNAQIAEASKSEDTRMLEKKEVEVHACVDADVASVTASPRRRRRVSRVSPRARAFHSGVPSIEPSRRRRRPARRS